MKLEINIDDSFLKAQEKLSVAKKRNVSFTKTLDILRDKSLEVRREQDTRLPSFVLDNKLIGYEFAKLCNLNTPKIIQMGRPLDEINFVAGTVIKPLYENSSKGVFIAYSDDNIVYLNKGERFFSNEEAKEYARKLLQDNVVRKNRWAVEELLIDTDSIARDLKFYCFYGKTGLILESGREDGIKRCWFDSDLNYVNTGKYSNILYKAPREHLLELKKLAENLSTEIPSAFVRIDFLICNGVFYVGEFTPIPGNHNGFNEEWDQELGSLYIDATIQLSCDIGNGKVFENYNNVEKAEWKIIRDFNK